jgi:cysteine-rich repeat protein
MVMTVVGLAGSIGAGCLRSGVEQCADGTTCPAGTTCTAAGCRDDDQLAACAGLADGADCAFGPVDDGVCAGGVCLARGCGNAVVEADRGERCDDGDQASGDGCAADCSSDERCGNSVIDVAQGEGCDDGDTRSGDGCSAGCAEEQARWQLRGDSPPPRDDLAAAYDAHRGRVVLFGGNTDTTVFGDTWEWDGRAWRELAAPTEPGPRARAAMAYHASRREIVLFGGARPQGQFDDTWIWNGVSWHRRSLTIRPEARQRHLLVADPGRDELILFGGELSSVSRGDTWRWDGVAWTKLDPAASPSRRHWSQAAYDPIRGRIVLYGGQTDFDGMVVHDDTWEWDGTTWIERQAGGGAPGRRRFAAMAWDAGRQRVVLFGGDRQGYQDDTWSWDGSTWHHEDAVGAPTARGFHGLVAAPDRGGLVLFGGQGQAFLNDTWVLTDRWRNLTPIRPPARSAPSLARDERRGDLVLFGGGAAAAPLDDTWLWNGAWRATTPVTRPPPRFGPALAYHPGTDRVVMFGGDDDVVALGDTWAWDGATWVEQVTSPSPGPRSGPQMVTERGRGDLLLFAGFGYDDAWRWDGAGWSEVPRVGAWPRRRGGHGMAYDERRHRVVLFGGDDLGRLGDTWEWDGTSWTQFTPDPSPEPRMFAAMGFDPRRGRVVLAGGLDRTNALLSDTWEWDGSRWTPIDAPQLPARVRAGMASNGAELLVFGGDDGGPTRDTWVFAYQATAGHADETCDPGAGSGADVDRDGAAGCADDDCAATCAPTCPVLTSCAAGPGCGDGTCSPIESCGLCPGDCGPCPTRCGDLRCDAAEVCVGDCP